MADEFHECEIKTRVLTSVETGRPPLEFDLLEALLWRPATGYFMLERHVARLRDSAEYFGFRFDGAALVDQLGEAAASLSAEDHKVRVVLSRSGDLAISAAPLSAIARPAVQRVRLAKRPIDRADSFLYHKTSRRVVYEAALAEVRAAHPDADDVILWNEHGEITESSTANVVIELNGELLTPPIDCGLLDGTFRRWLIDQRQIVERAISSEMLRAARRIHLINSVRKWMPAILID